MALSQWLLVTAFIDLWNCVKNKVYVGNFLSLVLEKLKNRITAAAIDELKKHLQKTRLHIELTSVIDRPKVM